MGFISKLSSSKIMLAALRMVLDGGVYLPPQLLQQAMAGLDQGGVDKRSVRSNKNWLTTRQMQTLLLLAEGLSNKEISEKLNLAEGTVKIHTAAVYQALRVNSRLEAVSAARRLGFLPAPESEVNESAGK
jgi:DNA-binding NarL/FixJ family response regulator